MTDYTRRDKVTYVISRHTRETRHWLTGMEPSRRPIPVSLRIERLLALRTEVDAVVVGLGLLDLVGFVHLCLLRCPCG